MFHRNFKTEHFITTAVRPRIVHELQFEKRLEATTGMFIKRHKLVSDDNSRTSTAVEIVPCNYRTVK
jgi:hypothetical protein